MSSGTCSSLTPRYCDVLPQVVAFHVNERADTAVFCEIFDKDLGLLYEPLET